MKRLFSLFTALVLAVALCAPAMADDQDNSTPTPASSEDAYVSAYTVTDAAGGEINKIEVGDRISAEYRIRSERSRSFVRFTAPRPACLECVDGRSRYCYPSAYREVKADRTEYWSELWPEQTTVLREEFHVVRAGEFSSEGLGIESVYAPHYRAGIPAEYQMISMPSETTQP